MSVEAIIAIGSNIGDRRGYIDRSIEMIGDRAGNVLSASEIIETKAYGYEDQDDFLNMAISLETDLGARDLLVCLNGIEADLDRTREIHWGPRTIDLDIIFYGDEIVDEEDLHIPHIDMYNRTFVLGPICDIAPEKVDPRTKKTVRELLEELEKNTTNTDKPATSEETQIGGKEKAAEDKEVQWTAEQQDAIERDGVNILVSAAAGSGKTTVLIERIARLITEKEVCVDRFLITTFTNAAASEMKERLKKKIDDKIGECADDPEKKKFLQRQIKLLPEAHIETFHSFAIGIIRDYFFLTDLQPGFDIGDETRIDLMKREVIDGIFEERFANDGERFKTFLRKYSKERNNDKLKESILSLYGEMLSIPHYMDWANERVEKLGASSPIDALDIEKFIASQAKARVRDGARCFAESAELINSPKMKGIYAKAKEDADKISALADKITEESSVEEIKKLLDIKYAVMTAPKDEKENYEEVKEEVTALRDRGKKYIKDLKDTYLSRDMDVAGEVIRSLYEDTRYYLGIIEELEAKLSQRKREENIIDFDDALHYAIRILEDEKAASDYRERFEYIFIDEYQDSNYLQEEIVGRIKRDDNLFMVGDIKQSIYRFRLAEPELFRRKYVDYGRDEEKDSAKIDLNNNFRSKGNIRRAVNAIFEDVMEGYDEKAALIGPADGGPEGPAVELHVIREYKLEDEEEEEREALSEAALIAGIIKEHVGKPYIDKKGREKLLKYSDIAVLSRGGKAVSSIERHLNSEDIPAYGDTGGGYYETVEVRVLMDLLSLISNFRQDVPLIAVMSAVFFDFTPTELAKIRIAYREGSFCDAVLAYEKEGEDKDIRDRIGAMLEQLERWRELARTLPLDELIRILLYETGYYDYCSRLPVGKRRISNLRLLMEKAQAFEKNSYSGLFGFLSYVDAMKNSSQKVNEAAAVGEGEDVVRVMTVHKSKGLEYPMVILSGAGKRIQGPSSGFDPAMDREFSIGLPLIDKEMHTRAKTLLQQVIADKKKTEELDEEIRILYVALTRAIDRLVVVGTIPESKNIASVPMKGSFLEMLYPAMEKLAAEEPDRACLLEHDSLEDPGAGLDKAGPGAEEWDEEAGARHEEAESAPEKADKVPEAPTTDEADMSAEIDRRLSFKYPYEYATTIRPKYTVTALTAARGGHVDDDELAEQDAHADTTTLPPSIPKIPDLRGLAADKKDLTAAEIGTIMHYIMEKIDFGRASTEGAAYVQKVVDELHESGVLDDAGYEVVSVEDIVAFFRDPLGERAAKATNLVKEKEFLMQDMVEGEPIIVQGVIDCFFEEDDGLVLIDFKNSSLEKGEDPAHIIDRYREQIRLYKRALEKSEDKPVKEAWLYLFKTGTFLKVDTD